VNLKPPLEKELVITQAVFLGDFLQKAYLSKTLGSFEVTKDKKILGLMEKRQQVSALLPERLMVPDERSLSLGLVGQEGIEAKGQDVLIKRYTFEKDQTVPLLNIQGPLSKRGLVFTPLKPEIPKWLRDKGAFGVTSKIYVDKQGRVVFVEQLSSTGYLEIDLLVKKYLKRLRFTPDTSAGSQESQWGTVKINLEVIND
jgi:hypothetical protein